MFLLALQLYAMGDQDIGMSELLIASQESTMIDHPTQAQSLKPA